MCATDVVDDSRMCFHGMSPDQFWDILVSLKEPTRTPTEHASVIRIKLLQVSWNHDVPFLVDKGGEKYQASTYERVQVSAKPSEIHLSAQPRYLYYGTTK
jgi:hypothetical protein